MKSVANTIAETLLVASFVVLFAIPVVVFGGFSPIVKKTTVKTPLIAKKDVLGVQTNKEESVASYKTELLPTTIESIVVEELEKESDSYELKIQTFKDNDDIRNENLLRIVNTSNKQQTIVIQISDFYKKFQLESLKLKVDDTSFSLLDLVEKKDFKPAIVLEPNEWLTVGIIVDEELKEPTFFTVKADFFEKE